MFSAVPWLRWLPYYETFGRVLFAMVLLLMVVGFIVAGFNTLAPMSVWVHYRGFEILTPNEQGEQYVRIDRQIQKWADIVSIQRYVELQ